MIRSFWISIRYFFFGSDRSLLGSDIFFWIGIILTFDLIFFFWIRSNPHGIWYFFLDHRFSRLIWYIWSKNLIFYKISKSKNIIYIDNNRTKCRHAAPHYLTLLQRRRLSHAQILNFSNTHFNGHTFCSFFTHITI